MWCQALKVIAQNSAQLQGKVLGVQLKEILDKHGAVLMAPALTPVTGEFYRLSEGVYRKYADRIVRVTVRAAK